MDFNEEDDDFQLTPHDTYLPGLLELLQPLSGELLLFASNHPDDQGFTSFSLTLDCGSFAYKDPFYGEMGAEPRPLYLQLDALKGRRLTRLQDLPGQSYTQAGDYEFGGYFSNSLDVVLLNYRFGAITAGVIDFEATFFFTNSDGYGYLTGERSDHARFTKTIRLPLPVTVLFEDVRGLGQAAMGAVLLAEEFDLDNAVVSEVGFRRGDCLGQRYRVKARLSSGESGGGQSPLSWLGRVFKRL